MTQLMSTLMKSGNTLLEKERGREAGSVRGYLICSLFSPKGSKYA